MFGFSGPGRGEGGAGLGRRGDFFGMSMSGGGQYIGSEVGCFEAPIEPGPGSGHFPNKAASCSISNFGSTSG